MRPPFRPNRPSHDETKTGCGSAGFLGLFGRHAGGQSERCRGTRMLDSGALRLVVVGLSAEQRHHGYDIIRRDE
jgi:hypothetical protein